ncbi:hypothetical protein [Metabacillus idriensis]|uniref:hypothetical protein n=1 Tax=Metabacillus idriensis TaxID=324768 RepID=UPI003D2BE047
MGVIPYTSKEVLIRAEWRWQAKHARGWKCGSKPGSCCMSKYHSEQPTFFGFSILPENVQDSWYDQQNTGRFKADCFFSHCPDVL